MLKLSVVLCLAAISAALPDDNFSIFTHNKFGGFHEENKKMTGEYDGERNEVPIQSSNYVSYLKTMNIIRDLKDAFQVCLCKDVQPEEKELAKEIANLLPDNWQSQDTETFFLTLIDAVNKVCNKIL